MGRNTVNKEYCISKQNFQAVCEHSPFSFFCLENSSSCSCGNKALTGFERGRECRHHIPDVIVGGRSLPPGGPVPDSRMTRTLWSPEATSVTWVHTIIYYLCLLKFLFKYFLLVPQLLEVLCLLDSSLFKDTVNKRQQ